MTTKVAEQKQGPLWNQDLLNDSFIYKLANLGKHCDKIKADDTEITDQEKKITWIVQCCLKGVETAMTLVVSGALAYRVGSSYLIPFKFGLMLGAIAGIADGYSNKKSPFLDRIKEKADLYACYKNKLYQPIQEIFQTAIPLSIDFTIGQIIPKYSYFNALTTSSSISYEYTISLTHLVLHLFKKYYPQTIELYNKVNDYIIKFNPF